MDKYSDSSKYCSSGVPHDDKLVGTANEEQFGIFKCTRCGRVAYKKDITHLFLATSNNYTKMSVEIMGWYDKKPHR